jgi:ATP-dependent Clp protease protease subunit
MPKKKKQKVEDQVQEPVQQEEELSEEEMAAMEEELLDQLSGGGKSIIVLPPMSGAAAPEKKIRVVPVIGDVGERMALEVVAGLLTLRDSGKKRVLSDPMDPNSEIIEKVEPIEMIVSTFGGSALDMFGICDMMRVVQQDCPIITTGIGKVMSAGVLILASGTKGARQIGRNTRVMIHSVIGGTHGSIHNIENEVEEIKWIQERYIDTLVRETDMTRRMVKKLLDKKVNIYLDAQQAVDFGIADIII